MTKMWSKAKEMEREDDTSVAQSICSPVGGNSSLPTHPHPQPQEDDCFQGSPHFPSITSESGYETSPTFASRAPAFFAENLTSGEAHSRSSRSPDIDLRQEQEMLREEEAAAKERKDEDKVFTMDLNLNPSAPRSPLLESELDESTSSRRPVQSSPIPVPILYPSSSPSPFIVSSFLSHSNPNPGHNHHHQTRSPSHRFWPFSPTSPAKGYGVWATFAQRQLQRTWIGNNGENPPIDGNNLSGGSPSAGNEDDADVLLSETDPDPNLPDIVLRGQGSSRRAKGGHLLGRSVSWPLDPEVVREVGVSLRRLSLTFESTRSSRTSSAR